MTEAGTRRPARRTRRPDRWKVLFVGLLVAAVLGVSGWALLGSRLLVVRHVEVTGTKLLTPDRVAAAAGIRLGLPMVRLHPDDVRRRVAGLHEVASARVERHWPATVRIVVRERVPVAAYQRGGRYFQVDTGGFPVRDGTAVPDVPLLTVGAPSPTDPPTLAALRVVGELPGGLRAKVAEVSAPTVESVTLRLRGGLTIVWGSPERAGEKARLAEAVMRTPAGRGPRTIDVSSPDVITTR
ncbi:Cell division protein FtsQ [Actinomadura rubteroloni]|uniref:Cell division protein FtsQ n=1 Tax=Actinomadura rubteroloni TaxID=1926885 RepID=A0A2P4UG60_9ACTN|nr:FtsQ-type POTRA domain-containing protein [Actinomadura rubteroloni]POM23988.1 Cell division protein FtsQ [Actinomadura rubteroloni]